MPNQNVNKVIYGGRVLIDLTGDTVDPSKLLKGSTVLTDPDGNELGRTVRSFSDNSSTIITTDSKGQKLVKKFSNNMLNMEAVLTDAAGKELARLTKVFSADGKDISSTVVYGK